jgi:hypothetical protein
LHQITRALFRCILPLVFFTSCKIENHSPQEIVQRFVSSKEECWVPIGLSEYIVIDGVSRKIEADSEFVRIPTFSSDSVGCPTQDAMLEFKEKNPNRFILSAKKHGFVENDRPIFGVKVYSREYAKSIPVSDGELRDKSAP